MVRRGWLVLVVVGCLWLDPAAVWAQKKKDLIKGQVAEPRSYGLPYAATAALIGLGLAAVLRPGNRLWEVAVEDE